MSYYHYDPLATIKAEIEKVKAEDAKKTAYLQALARLEKAMQRFYRNEQIED